MNCPNCGGYQIDTDGRCMNCGFQVFSFSNSSNWITASASDYSAALIAMTAKRDALKAALEKLSKRNNYRIIHHHTRDDEIMVLIETDDDNYYIRPADFAAAALEETK